MATPRRKTAAPVTGTPRRRRATQGRTAPDQQAIALRAYELYLARGGAHGHDRADWLTAERELSGAPPGEVTP